MMGPVIVDRHDGAVMQAQLRQGLMIMFAVICHQQPPAKINLWACPLAKVTHCIAQLQQRGGPTQDQIVELPGTCAYDKADARVAAKAPLWR